MKYGYVYVATGEQYVQEAITSAKSLKKVDRSSHVTLITDKAISNDLFDYVALKPNRFSGSFSGYLYKIEHLYEDSPYEKTLFIDTDTYFYENCQPAFRLLDFYDICMAHAPGDMNELYCGEILRGYTPYNSGVIFFKKCLENEALFLNWFKLYEEKIAHEVAEHDQPAFMEALLKSKSRVYVLQNIWNARTIFYINLFGRVKIVHGRHKDYEALRSRINETEAQRCWDPVRQRCLFERDSWAERMKRRLIPSFQVSK